MLIKIKDLIEILNKMDAEQNIIISEYNFQVGKWNKHILELSYVDDKEKGVAYDSFRLNS